MRSRTCILASAVLCLICICESSAIFAQTLQSMPQAKDAQAIAVAQRVLMAITKGTPITDLALIGTATQTLGSEQRDGTASLKAGPTGSYRLDLTIGSDTFAEGVYVSQDQFAGYWIDNEKTFHNKLLHNSLLPGPWFSPITILNAAISAPQLALSYVGQEQIEGVALDHLRVWRLPARQSEPETTELARLSAVDVYVDALTAYPVLLVFRTHPDNDSRTDMLVEVSFSGYRDLNGISVPLKIEKRLNGCVVLDLSVTNAVANSGLSDADFVVEGEGR